MTDDGKRFDYVFPCGAGYWGIKEVKNAKKMYGKERFCVFDTEGGPDTPLFPDDVEEVKASCFNPACPHDNGCGGDGEGREAIRSVSSDETHDRRYVVLCLAEKKPALRLRRHVGNMPESRIVQDGPLKPWQRKEGS